MHRDERSRANDWSDEEIANDITAYMRTLVPPAVSNKSDAAVEIGLDVFHKRGCAKCHDPGSSYTSPQVYDVGVRDEVGMNLFNPPSLIGLRHRRAFFHDARFRTLDELLKTHPDPKAPVSPDELSSLKAFLLTL